LILGNSKSFHLGAQGTFNPDTNPGGVVFLPPASQVNPNPCSRASVLETSHSTNETGATNCYMQKTEEMLQQRTKHPREMVITIYIYIVRERERRREREREINILSRVLV